MPNGEKYRQLGEYAAIRTGQTFKSAPKHLPEGDLRIIQPRDLEEGQLVLGPIRVTGAEIPMLPKPLLQPGEILIANKGTKFGTFLYQGDPARTIATASFLCCHPSPEFCRLIQSTSEAFLSSINDRSLYYDLILSLIAWKALSAYSVAEGEQRNKKITSPGPGHQFDLVMQSIGEARHKEMVSRALSVWETSNPENLTGLMVPARDLISEVPETIWEYICLSWTRFLASYGPKHSELANQMICLMDHLELTLSEDRLTSDNYAPKELVGLMVHLIDDGPGESLYDPHCWSGGFLSAAMQKLPGLQHVKGFTATGLPWKLAKLRLLILFKPVDIRVEPGLNYDKLPDKQRFDYVLMNPPYGRGQPRYLLPREQGAWADLAYTSGRIDLAFVCHSLDRLSTNGTAAIILPGIFLSARGGGQKNQQYGREKIGE